MNSLRQRHREPEIQDQPDLDDHLLRQALVGREHINFWSRSAQVLWPPIFALARQAKSPLRILDIATGAGDVPLTLWRLARQHHVGLRLEGCDLNPRTVAYAQHQARKMHADVRFFQLDALSDPIRPDYDVIMCSLFLHHLSESQAVLLLGRMATAAQHMILVSDLLRSMTGLALAYFSTRWLIHSPVNRIDSVRSVKAAFTIEEVRALTQRAGLSGATIEKRWPCRFLLTCKREPGFSAVQAPG